MQQPDPQLVDDVEVGRKLGHDLFQYGRSLDPAVTQSPVVEGFLQAQAQDVRRQGSDRYKRKWLQLRVNAYRRRRHVAEQVTAELIEKIDVPWCPVLRVPLTHGELLGTDWSVDRLNNDGAYAPSNLAVMSTQANKAKSHKTFEEVYVLSQQGTPDSLIDGLTPDQWLRLAALMLGPCYATQPGSAPLIPLVAPVPRYTIRQIAQLQQHVLTVMAVRPSGKNVLIKALDAACTTERGKTRLRFLAETVHRGLKGLEHPWDVWLQPDVMRLFGEWRCCLDERAWGMTGEISRQLAGGQRVDTRRLEAWRLPSRGYF